jgi:hypothetical protein
MTRLIASLLAATAFLAAPAFAADLPSAAQPAATPAPAPTTTLTFETSPEFKAASGATQNDLADWYGKGTVSYSFAPGWSVAGAIQDTLKPATSFHDLYQAQVEGSIAYKFKLTDAFTVTGTAGLGYTWGNTGYVGGLYTGAPAGAADAGNDDDAFGYYFLQASLDYKLDSHWTWNVIQARYRNAFNETWITPKLQTGITYNIDATDAVYAALGYAWKDKGDGNGLQPDKYNIAVGYKYSF